MEVSTTIHERIELLVEKFGRGRNTVFASLIDTNEANIRGYIRNIPPKYDIMEKIVNRLGVNPEWLLVGEGPMLKADLEEATTQKVEEEVKAKRKDAVSVPIIEISAAAGSGYENPDYLEEMDTVDLPLSWGKPGGAYYCIRVKGESMTPTILDSSYVMIRLLDRSEWASMPEEHVYVICDRDGHAYIKRVKNRLKDKGFIVCMSDNPDKFNFPNFNLQEEEINRVFHVEWLLTAKMPNIHRTYYAQIGELQDSVDELKLEMGKVLRTLYPSK